MADQAILLVDDEPQILNSVRRLLRKESYRGFTAESGAEGLAVLRENTVHMIISDQRIPQMTGTEFLQQAKKLCPEAIRVMLSGYAEPEAILASINLGEVFRFIAKPWDDDDLRATIRQCMEHHAIVEENRRLTEQSARQVEQLEVLNRMLKMSVDERTRSLQFSQEVFENLPAGVLGISQDEELVLTNGTARREFAALRSLLPGADMTEVLPPTAVEAVRKCLTADDCATFTFTWDDKAYRASPRKLGTADRPRGLVLMIEESDA